MTHTHDTLTGLITQGPGSNSVYAVQRPDGSWSIVLNLDGRYSTAEDATHMADFWREQIARTTPLRVHRGADLPNGKRETK